MRPKQERIEQLERDIKIAQMNIRDGSAGSFTPMLRAELQTMARSLRKLREE